VTGGLDGRSAVTDPVFIDQISGVTEQLGSESSAPGAESCLLEELDRADPVQADGGLSTLMDDHHAVGLHPHDTHAGQ